MKQQMKYIICLALLLLLGGGVTGAQGFDPSNPPDPYMLYKVVATANDGNYTSGSGSYTAGTVVTLNTSAQSTVYTFLYWTKNGEIYTTNKQFNYTVEAENVTFRAVYAFNPDNPSDPQAIDEYRLYLVPDPEGACSFSRTSGAKAEAGKAVSVTAYASQGFVFEGWYNGDTKLSASTTLSGFMMPSANTTLTARFTYNPTTPADPVSSYALGDVNQDRELNVTDVIALTNYIMNSDPNTPILLYDTNSDGEVNVTDVIRLVNKIMNNQ